MADKLKVTKAKLADLIPDDRNLNKGTERGKQLIAKSLNKFGAVRGIAVDKDNRIIAGNKTVENAIEQGIEDVIIVETTGRELVVTRRTDTSLDTQEGREMALADNATVKVDLEWDTEEMKSVADDYDINLEDWCDTMEDETENPYTMKIESPVYEAKGECPKIAELYNIEKTKQLTESIENSKIDEEIKTFLRLAATRHTVFDYGKIAEYYCHASKDVQRLMEESALIIIDFKDAIGGGYVRLRDDIRQIMEEDVNYD